ncbi:hypothetical protein VME0621_01067 [Vibrio mediterranei]|nr:hypothetical protein VME0621_01067 [Vibrio mediterranei]
MVGDERRTWLITMLSNKPGAIPVASPYSVLGIFMVFEIIALTFPCVRIVRPNIDRTVFP